MLGPHVPDLAGLQMLVSVGELGSLTRAAAVLGVSQQAVSSRVRSLEGQIGASLIVRSARGSTLTATGTMVTGWAADVLEAAARMEAGIEALRSQALRHLDVAASLTIAEYLLPRWLVTLRDREESAGHVATRVGLTVANSEAVIALVRAGTVPLGFIETPNIPADLRTATIGHDTLMVAVAPTHAWAQRRRQQVTAQELADTPLITREEGSGTRQALDHLLESVPEVSGALASPRLEYSTTAAVRTAIASGVAPGVLSSMAIADDLALGRLIAIDVAGLTLTRTLSAVWASGPHPSQVLAQEMIAIARQPLPQT
ncbi:LysR family transcriptional regulator [Cryobacterium sp. PH29-G1]|uniref:LysR family transcriptional regulator n=1 Tax=Cryobacterium sp. PH29-G1 TaxID=3046211 RepID=UPI0024B8E650|nr:LysR family transcriptional regulator [Cryobacterium sp. PH29-G1]MDJ0349937.1 LysR family transcriptional regulator [Cryobacterium sp. PH29-G1]